MKSLKRIAAIAVLSACVIIACAACSSSSSSSNASSSASGSVQSASTASAQTRSSQASYTTQAEGDYASGIHHATVKVEGYEPFVITLNADDAPVSVANFCKLAQDGFYNGKAFYRIVEGFCLQGGSEGDSSYALKTDLVPIVGEFSENGVKNALADSFVKGTVAMARTNNDYNSATSTFFITLASTAMVSDSLDGKYAAFGTIDEAGMQIVDAIVANHAVYATGQAGSIDEPKNMPRMESITITD